jgi:hypothetical protein
VVPFNPSRTGNPALESIVQALINTFRSLQNAVTNDNLVTTKISTYGTRVFHGLGRPPTTWEVVGLQGPYFVYEDTFAEADRTRFLVLRAEGDVTATIRFS